MNIVDKDGILLTYKLNGKTYIASYDSGNYLTNNEKTSYAYDHEGNRTKIIDGEKQTDLFVDTVSSKYSQVLQETTNGESIYYIYGNGLIGHYDETNAFTTYHYDSRGSTVATTDASGIVTGEAAYDEYGVILSNTVNSRFLYNGQYGVETDDNGLYYMRARYYNPELKRFMNRDVIAGSIENNQTLNRYAYTNGNPISFIDPFGLARETSKWSKWGHVVLDIGGATPVLGEFLDAANAVWYLAEGDYENAAYSAAAMTPLGTIATVTKYGKKAKNVLADNSGYVKLPSFSKKELSNKIPSIRNGEFNKWFDGLSSEEFNKMWEIPELRKTIENRIRKPGGYHEWHLVSRTNKFKEWGISMNDIKEMRTFTKDVKFVNPSGFHGGTGSTTAHNQILHVIDTSADYESFVKRLNNWAGDRLENGKMGLPIGLRR